MKESLRPENTLFSFVGADCNGLWQGHNRDNLRDIAWSGHKKSPCLLCLRRESQGCNYLVYSGLHLRVNLIFFNKGAHYELM